MGSNFEPPTPMNAIPSTSSRNVPLPYMFIPQPTPQTAMGYAMPQPPSAFPFQVPFGTQNSGTRKIRRHGELATYLSGEVIKEPPVPYVSLEQVAVRSPPLPPVIRGSPLIRRDEWIHALGPARPGFSGPAIISGFARRLSLVKTIEGHTYEPITQEEIILFFKSAPDGIVSAQYLFQNFPGQDRLASQESYMKFHEMFLKVSEFNEGIGAYRLKENNGLNQRRIRRELELTKVALLRRLWDDELEIELQLDDVDDDKTVSATDDD